MTRREGTASALCAAYMVKHNGVSLEHALNTIKMKRPEIKPSPSYYLQLQEYEQYVNKKRRFKNSTWGYISEKLFGYLDVGYFQYFGEGHNIIEKVSHNWIQLTIYFLIVIFVFRFLVQFIMLNLSNDLRLNVGI